MALIRPFKGIRYNQSLVKDLEKVISPPYDVIGPEEQDVLHKKSPYNIIRLENGKSYTTDNNSCNHYIRASVVLEKWLQESILLPENRRCYYLYEQAFSYNGINYKRHGIIAALKLTPYAERNVLPHEQTMAGPKADRLKLLKHLKTDVSPIFTLFPDSEQLMQKIFSTIDYNNPSLRIDEDSGQAHRLWTLSNPEMQDSITTCLAPQSLLIADGHHRYEKSLNYYQSSKQPKAHGAGFILNVMVSMKDTGLLVLPTHRLLHNMTYAQIESMLKIIKQKFDLIDQGNPLQLNRKKFIDDISKISIESKGFGLITARQASLLVPRDEMNSNSLPVEMLHDHIINSLLKSQKTSETGNIKVSYPHELEATVDAVRNKAADAAFILEPIAVDKIFDRARQGRVMPQKSTFFYPKLPSGLVLYNMDLSF